LFILILEVNNQPKFFFKFDRYAIQIILFVFAPLPQLIWQF